MIRNTVNPDIPPPPPKGGNRNAVIVVLFILAYLFNSNVAEWVYPLAKDVFSEWEKYYDFRNQMYSVMFFLAFVFMFYNTRGLLKAIAAFAVFVSFASTIDKCIYNFYQFKATDWIVIGAGVLGAIYVYYYGKNRRY